MAAPNTLLPSRKPEALNASQYSRFQKFIGEGTTGYKEEEGVCTASVPQPHRYKTPGALISGAAEAVVPPAFQGGQQFSKAAVSTAKLWHCAL